MPLNNCTPSADLPQATTHARPSMQTGRGEAAAAPPPAYIPTLLYEYLRSYP